MQKLSGLVNNFFNGKGKRKLHWFFSIRSFIFILMVFDPVDCLIVANSPLLKLDCA